MRRRATIALAACLFLLSHCSTTATGRNDAAAFRDDLAFLARELPKRHKNAFHYTSRAQFDAAVAELNSRIPTIDRDHFTVGVMRIAAMIGDSHTRAHLPLSQQRPFPIAIRRYGDDYRIVQVPPGLERALGTRILEIDETPANRFESLLAPLVAQNENATFIPAWVNLLLQQAPVLHGAGIIANADTARFRLEKDDGTELPIDLRAVSASEFSNVAWIPIAKPTRLQQIAEAMRAPVPTFSFTWIPSARAVYANVKSMANVGRPARQLFALIRERQPEKVIIDLRQNPGGNYFHGLHGLIEPIAKLAAINRKGHLFVLIGPLTGSAAVINAAQFHTKTQAILVGEAIGTKPSEYSELKNMTLPNTGIIVGYSVRFYDFAYNAENVVAPDHEVKPAWEDVKHGIDSALEWCLQYGNFGRAAT